MWVVCEICVLYMQCVFYLYLCSMCINCMCSVYLYCVCVCVCLCLVFVHIFHKHMNELIKE